MALNSLNQSVGQPDTYPFVLTPAVQDKPGLVHEIVRHRAARPQVSPPPERFRAVLSRT